MATESGLCQSCLPVQTVIASDDGVNVSSVYLSQETANHKIKKETSFISFSVGCSFI